MIHATRQGVRSLSASMDAGMPRLTDRPRAADDLHLRQTQPEWPYPALSAGLPVMVRVFYIDERADDAEPHVIPYVPGMPIPAPGDIIGEHRQQAHWQLVTCFRVVSRWFDYHDAVLIV